MPLSMVNAGQNVILKSINWGTKLKKKLQDMGLTEGVMITVISDNLNGSSIINVRGSRLVLDSSVTNQIIVEAA
ncbi:FeoA family protein [Brassicibacter mesophilus]|uniref:FeoA family protein n=1 Tax=Brassicibacter mesophilus TaxID=745119 RepID=UPI003D24C678